MGRTRKGGSRRKSGGFLEALKAAANNQAARLSEAAKEAADKAKKMASDAHRATIKNIDKGKVKFEQTAHAATTQAKNIASKTGAAAALATGGPPAMGNPQSGPSVTGNPQSGGNRRKTHKRKHRRKTHKRKHRRKTHKRKHRRKRKTHRRHH